MAGRVAAEKPRRRNLVRWLPAAAAILAAVVIVSQVISNREAIGYARIINPSDLEVLQSHTWVKTEAGEVLHPGDWMRKVVPGAAEILWHDSCRLSLEAGTLAHIPDHSLPFPDQVVLFSGSIASEVQSSGRSFEVRTPAGSVTASAGTFAVRVTDFALTQLEVGADRSEVLTGTVVSLGQVRVSSGKVLVRSAKTTLEVGAGEVAAFAQSESSGATARLAHVEAALKVATEASERGSLSSSLTAAADGLILDLKAVNVRLSRLVECATGLRVRGGEGVSVTGNLRVPAPANAESIASAVGAALGLPISFGQEMAPQATVTARHSQTPTPEWVEGNYRFEKSRGGQVSFEFRAMPARQAFQILRSAGTDLPELAAEAEWRPLTLQASDLNPSEVAGVIEKALGLSFENASLRVNVIAIGTAVPAAPGAIDGEPGTRTLQAPAAGGKEPGSLLPEANRSSRSRQPLDADSGGNPEATVASGRRANSAIHPVWSVLGGRVWRSRSDTPATPVGPGQSVANGRASQKLREFFNIPELASKPILSQYLIWPALGAEDAYGGGPAYVVANPTGLAARTQWHGYDRTGQLLVQCELIVPGSSTLSLTPLIDLPAAVGEGGHWETISDLPLAGSRSGSASGFNFGSPVASERLPGQWSFPAVWMSELEGCLWLVNPNDEPATIVLALKRESRVVASEQVVIPPRGGMIWPDPAMGTNLIPAGSASGSRIVVYALRGYVGAGLAR
jgi:hypothetical protein